ncbi:TPA: peptidoglycan DD-metalloendopeptidase family protein [Pseudomonas aeruginosa]
MDKGEGLRLAATLRQWTRLYGGCHLLLGAVVCSLLAACSSSPPGGVKVVDRNGSVPAAARRTPVTSGQYIVRRGDTLYSIAFRFGWDWKALAARNGIAPPYTIQVGQAIQFGGRASAQPSVAKNTPVVAAPVATKPTPVPPAVSTSVPAKPAPAPASTTTPPSSGATPVVAGPAVGGWAWPASGTLIGRFASNGSLNKGIDIAGQLGQPVLAASGGTVVYAGSGLRGYGELVIIKHNETYVSAYGHNRRLLVREGQQVKVGQSIAEMGSTGTDRVKLHFEIRRQGKPVDPLQYLPRR